MIDGQWFVAQALPGLEATAIYNLSRDEIEAYAPAVADRKARLFPGYVFVRLIGLADCFRVNRTRGILRLLPKHLGEPLPLPDTFVPMLMERISSGEFDEETEADLYKKFLPEQIVEALTGPYRERPGRFSRFQKGSAIVIGYLLGKEIEYAVPVHQLRHAGEGNPPKSRSAPLRAA